MRLFQNFGHQRVYPRTSNQLSRRMNLHSKVRVEDSVYTKEFVAQDLLPTQTTDPPDCRALAAICILYKRGVSYKLREVCIP